MKINKTFALTVLISMLAGLFIGGQIVTSRTAKLNTTDDSAEAGFARDMGDHHQQAVEMSFIIRDRSDDSAVRLLAFDIINTQATQRGIMMGWLEQWGLTPTTTRPHLAWAGSSDHQNEHSVHGMIMPGMATTQEIEKLRSLKGKEADILYMQLMIRHHHGGVNMAKDLISLGKRAEVKQLAQTMVNGQQAEIELLTQMLQDRGASP